MNAVLEVVGLLALRVEEDAVRRAYLVTLGAPLLFVVTIWLVAGAPTVFVRLVLPLVAAVLACTLIGVLLRRLRLDLVGPVMFGLAVVVLFGRLLLWRLGVLPEAGSLTDPLAEAVWLALIFPLGFVVFGVRRGLQVSVLLYVAFIGVAGDVLIAAITAGSIDIRFLLAIGLPAIFAALIGLLWLFSTRLERLAHEQARAEMFAEQALTDALTGVANRRKLEDHLDRLLADPQGSTEPFAVVLVDLDRFKRVNDVFGHTVGDEVLIEVTARMRAQVRADDVVGRWGGEEFLLLAPQTTLEDAAALAERCRRHIAEQDMPEVGRVTASFGVATFEPGDSARTLVRRADLALYTAKEEGRNRVVALPSVTSAESISSTTA
ncbi:MAG: GGDEF domain-containing protein [Nitriliruptoraceae bacterium]